MIIKKLFLFVILFFSQTLWAEGYTANSVWYEIHPNFVRIFAEYTMPEIKELRQAYFETRSNQKASEVYWKLLRGGHFVLDGNSLKFLANKRQPTPW